MKKSTKKFCLIKATVYPCDVLITTADDKDLFRYIEKNKHYKLTEEEKKHLSDWHGNGRTTRLLGGQIIVRLRPSKTKIGIDLAILAHELFHVLMATGEYLNIKISDDSEEAFAYYQGWLIKQALLFYGP